MLPAEVIAQAADVVISLFAVMIFLMVDVIGGTKNDVVVDVSFVNVGSDNIRVFSLQKFVGKLHAYLVGFLIRNLAGEKRLYQMIGFIWIGLVGF